MKLPLKFLEKKEPSEYYLALVLRNEKAVSVIFEKQGQNIKFISTAEEYFENTVEDSSSEEFLNVLDKVITRAETALPENVETHKTILGLKENWVEDNKIKKEYLDKLKKASDELSLEPVGFLVFVESIINLIQKEEGAPVTAILADMGKKFVSVSWIKAGKILESRSAEIHESPAYTVDALLKHFQTPGNMPSRIILFDSEEDELEQEFIGYSWSKSLSFLHLPQIVNLSKDTTVKAMLLGAATQMGTGIVYDKREALRDFEEEPFKKEPEEETFEEEPKGKMNEPVLEEESPDFVPESTSLEYFGFLEGEDVVKTETPEATNTKAPDQLLRENFEEIPDKTGEEEQRRIPLPVNAAMVTARIKKFAPVFLASLRKVKFNKEILSHLKGGGAKTKIIPAVIVLILVMIFLLYSGRKATVTVLVNPEVKQQTANVTFSTNSSTDINSKTLAAQNLTVDESGSVTEQATGTKNVGTQAKGQVTIFNISSSPVTLSQGTTITSSNNLDFTLDSSVTVASASGDAISGINPSTANVNVTASDIGQEYNLPSGTKFSIGDNSQVAAKNDNAFSGGTKKQITVVSKADIQKALSDLPKQLKQKAKTDIQGKTSKTSNILPGFISETVTSQNFDKKEGDQASQVTLTGTVSFDTLSYSYSDISDLAKSLFNTQDAQINQSSLSVSAQNIKTDQSGDTTADLTINAKILPKIDTSSLTEQIKGVSKFKAQNIVEGLPQVKSVTISISPPIPLLPDNLPGNSKNINILINSD